MQQPRFRNPIGTPLIELQSVDSTNNYARDLIHAGLAQHGMVIFAHEQTAGKAQRGRVWISEKGNSIALSIILKPQPLLLAQQFQLSASIALAAHEFFSRYAGNDTRIKWPNDLYWQDRKAGGILIESVVGSGESEAASPGSPSGTQFPDKGAWNWAIVGVGININQTSFPPHLPNPVSLQQITGKNSKTLQLATEFCAVVEKNLQELGRSGFDTIFANYNLHLYKKNEKVKFRKDTRVFEAVIKRITPAGKIVLQHSIDEEFDFGELEWII